MLPTLFTLTHEAISVAVLLSLPVLGAAFVASLLTGWLSSAAQIQDPALSFAPRLAAVAIVVLALGGWGAHTLLHFTSALWQAIPALPH